MNNGGIDHFNESQKKKYGTNYATRTDYMDDYQQYFESVLSRNFSKSLNDFRLSNDDYKRAESLIKKYDMEKWDNLAKSNAEGIRELEKSLE